MSGTLGLLARLPEFRRARRRSRVTGLPATLTLSVLYACNSRCATCHVYENKAKVLELDEYERIFKSLGRAPRWVTISGGEPFLRKDLGDILLALHKRCRPAIINIPTNGTLPDRVAETVDRVAGRVGTTSLVVNLSIDEVGAAHDRLRGFDGNWELAVTTANELKRLQKRHANVTFGINTVISRFNEERISAVADAVRTLDPDSYIAEVAERRVELLTRDLDIAPSVEGARRGMRTVSMARRRPRRLIELLVASLREEYYRLLDRYVEEPAEILPCYAAITSAHIMPEGKVWACCVLGEELGDLRATNYDFPAIWSGAQANAIRRRIRTERCHCPLANQAYLNIIVDPRSLVRAGARVARMIAAP